MAKQEKERIIATAFQLFLKKGYQEMFLKNIRTHFVFKKIFTVCFFGSSLSCLLFFTSCSQKQETKEVSASSVLEMRKLEKIVPKDVDLSNKYKRSCLICHSNPDAEAPLVHDAKAWDKLMNEKGIEELLQNVINGYNNMPVKGQCADCSEEDLKKLVEFLAGTDH